MYVCMYVSLCMYVRVCVCVRCKTHDIALLVRVVCTVYTVHKSRGFGTPLIGGGGGGGGGKVILFIIFTIHGKAFTQ